MRRAPELRFGRFIISAPTPFSRNDLAELRTDPWAVVQRLVPGVESIYAQRRWAMFRDIDRVYVSDLAASTLGWSPQWSFSQAIDRIREGRDFRSPLARAVGIKGYHDTAFDDGPYPVEQ